MLLGVVAAKQFRWLDPEAVSEGHDARQGQVAGSGLDAADVLCVKLGRLGQLFLRQSMCRWFNSRATQLMS